MAIHPDLFAIKRHHQDLLLGKAHVLGVGLGEKHTNGRATGVPAVKVFVSRKLPTAVLTSSDLVPPSLQSSHGEAVTDVEEMAPVMAPVQRQSAGNPDETALSLRSVQRPVFGGLSASHFQFEIGTIAIPVADRTTSERYLLSNNHVFARLNNASIGDPIIQPALIDGGSTANNTIATLHRFIPLKLDGTSINIVDAALALIEPDAELGQVAFVGAPAGVRPARNLSAGESVRKVGRTTGLTSGTVVSIGTRLQINYAIAGFGNQVAMFDEQILTSPMADFGDSGSLLLDKAGNAVGMLGGGSTTHTVYNPCDSIEELLSITIGSGS
jgi:hypothetical protein